MKYDNMGIKGTVLIRLIKLQALKSVARSKIKRKKHNTEIAKFPLYFWGHSFIIFIEFVAVLPLLKRGWNYIPRLINSKTKLFKYPHIYVLDFCNFHSTLMCTSFTFVLIPHRTTRHLLVSSQQTISHVYFI